MMQHSPSKKAIVSRKSFWLTRTASRSWKWAVKEPAALAQPALLFLSLFSFSAFADNLECNRDQTSCEVINSDFYTGDKVGILNEDGELVARGIVSGIEGRHRKISIKQKFAPIKPDFRAVLMDYEGAMDSKQSKVYKSASKRYIGADLMLGSFNIGSGVTGFGVEGFGVMRSPTDLEYVARANFQSLSGSVTRSYNDKPSQTVPFAGTLLGATAGLGYTAFKRNAFALHSDAGLGFTYLSASVDGTAGDVNDGGYSLPVKNGFGFMLKGYLGGIYTKDKWHFDIGAGVGLVQNAFFAAGQVGGSFDF